MAHDLLKIPNLISMGRLILLIPAGYFLSQPGVDSRLYTLAFLTAAALSDVLDGYLARRLNQQTRLGLILDPLSDKILAGALAVLLIVYRDFPIWLAAVIIGRDLLIMLGGLMIKSRLRGVPPSNLSGKYAFTAIAVLLISYVIEYDFGIRLFTIIAVVLVALSLFVYGRTFVFVLRTGAIPKFDDRPTLRLTRAAATWIVAIIYLVMLGRFIGWI